MLPEANRGWSGHHSMNEGAMRLIIGVGWPESAAVMDFSTLLTTTHRNAAAGLGLAGRFSGLSGSSAESMSNKMAGIIIGYGVILLALSLALRSVSPQQTMNSFVILGAGLLAILIGAAAWMGEKRRRWIVLTSMAFAFFMLVQAIGAWSTDPEESAMARRLLLSVTWLLSVAMALYSVHGERSAEFYRPATNKSERRGASE